MSFGITEILLIFLIVLILFGAKKLPEVAKSMGKAFKVFKKEVSDFEDSLDEKSDNDNKNNKK
ncbi:MAG TPA: twin-arginine translocase TatA/TatE family subunit [Candidatus Mcinerneyibacterium sp.]|nr:twin-arginine translocase TatA/TatE family subunit [Candidatus Mcinerneyibacterium sp.]